MLKRHTGSISSLAFSPDGLLIASAGHEDVSVRVWDYTTGELLKVFVTLTPGFFERVIEVCFSPNGDRLYANAESSLFAWSWPAGELIYRKRLLSTSCPRLSPDGRLACLTEYRGVKKTIRLFDLFSERKLPYTFPEGSDFEEFSPDGSALMLRWDSSEEEQQQHMIFVAPEWQLTHQTPLGGTYGLISLNGRPALTRRLSDEEHGESLHLHVYDESFKSVVEDIPLDFTAKWEKPDLLQSVPGTKFIVGCSMAATPQVFDLETENVITTLAPGPDYDRALAMNPFGSCMGVGDESGSIRIVRTNDWKVERSLRGLGGCRNLAVSADGKWLAMERGHQIVDTVWLWDLGRLCLVGQMQAPSLQTANEWSLQIGDLTFAYIPDLKWLGAEGSEPHQLVQRALSNYGIQSRFGWRMAPNRAVTSDGRWLAWIADEKIAIVDVRTETAVHAMPFQPPNGDMNVSIPGVVGLAISPSGWKAAIGLTFDSQDVLVFDFKRRRVTEKRACCDTFDSLAFDPLGRYLAIGDCYVNDIYLRPITSKVKRRTLSGHTNSIRSLSFAPNGDLISSGADGQVIVWDSENFDRKATLVVFDEPFGWAGFTPAGEIWGSPGVDEEFASSSFL